MKKNKNDESVKNKVTLGERISLSFRKKWIVSGTITLLLVLILITGYIALNLWITELDLPEIDVTENQVYTLSDTSKKAIEKINKEITIYSYGYEENSTLVNFIKQYCEANSNIKHEILSETSNLELMEEYSLTESYYSVAIIVQSGDTKKFIDPSYDFSSYDTTTYEEVDITEQTLTNTILSLAEENKPKIYFVEGHGEFTTSNGVSTFSTYLKNEFYEIESINMLTTGKIPEDCDILAIMSPSTDFSEGEANLVKDYINKGGNIFFTQDPTTQTLSLPNVQSILDLYGVAFDNGYILEYASNSYYQDTSGQASPIIFRPQLSSENNITSDLSTEGATLWLVAAGRLKFTDDASLTNLNVTKEVLMSSSEQSAFATNLSGDLNTAAQSAQTGVSEIAALMTKNITTTAEDGTSSTVDSKLMISASGGFMSDSTAVFSQYPLFLIGSNGDFALNSMAELADKDYTLSIRKNMNTTSYVYVATTQQNYIVLAIIFLVPIAIILVGVFISIYRKKRK